MFLITLIMTKKEISNLRKEVNKIKLTKEQIASNKARNFIMKLIAKLNGDWVPTPENYGWYIYSKYLYWNGTYAGARVCGYVLRLRVRLRLLVRGLHVKTKKQLNLLLIILRKIYY